MQHISDQQWLDYLEGECSAAERQALESHRAACLACRERGEQHLDWDKRFRQEAARVRSRREVDPRRLETLASELNQRLRSESQSSGPEVRIRLATRVLRRVLDPICGRNAVDSLLRTACGSHSSSLEALGADTWKPFIVNVRSAVGAVYGIKAAQMVEAVANRIAWDMAA